MPDPQSSLMTNPSAPPARTAEEVIQMFSKLGLPVCDDGPQIKDKVDAAKDRYLRMKKQPDPKRWGEADAWFRDTTELQDQSQRQALLQVVYQKFSDLADVSLAAAGGRGKVVLTPVLEDQLRQLARTQCRVDSKLADQFLVDYKRKNPIGSSTTSLSRRSLSPLSFFAVIAFLGLGSWLMFGASSRFSLAALFGRLVPTHTPTSTATQTATLLPEPTATSTSAEEASLWLLNPSFESAGLSVDNAASWTNGSNHGRSSDKVHQGQWSLKSTYMGQGTMTVSDPIWVSPNTNYTLSGWIYKSSQTGNAYIDLGDTNREATLGATRTNAWEFVSVTWNSGSNKRIGIRLITDANPDGPIWFDDISFSVAPSVTATASPTATRTRGPTQAFTRVPPKATVPLANTNAALPPDTQAPPPPMDTPVPPPPPPPDTLAPPE